MAWESRLAWQGAIPPNRITIVHDPHVDREIDPAIEAAVDAEWQRQVTIATARAATIYDAPAFRLNAHAIGEGGITFSLASIPYRYHAAFKAIHRRPDVRPEHADRVLIVDSIVRTADDHIALHTVEKVVETETYLIGGTCSTSRMHIGSGADLADYALDRVDAVTGVQHGERWIGDLVALVENEIGCVHAIFDVTTSLTAAELAIRFRPGPTSKALVLVPADEMVAWCGRQDGYMRVLQSLTDRTR